MAHVERRGNGRWRARYRTPNGSERSKTFERKTDAERWLANVEVEKQRGQWVDPRLGRTTVGEWAERWLDSLVRPKPKTIYGYRSVARVHVLPAFAAVPLNRVETVAVREWVADMVGRKVGPATVRQAVLVLSQVLEMAVRDGLIARNPVKGVEVPRVRPRERHYLTAEQVVRLAQAIDPRYATLIWVLAGTGLRFGEAAALRRGRCDLLRKRIEVVESLEEVGGALVLGHSSIQVTLDTYGHLYPDALDAAAQRLDDTLRTALARPAAQGDRSDVGSVLQLPAGNS